MTGSPAVAGVCFNTASSTYQDVTGATVTPTISSSGSVIQAIAQGNMIITNGAGTTADLVARWALRNGAGTVLREGSVTLDSRVTGANESVPFTLLFGRAAPRARARRHPPRGRRATAAARCA